MISNSSKDIAKKPSSRSFALSGANMKAMKGVEVWLCLGKDGWKKVTEQWTWAQTGHIYIEVYRYGTAGSYWVQTSSHPPKHWEASVLCTTKPEGTSPIKTRTLAGLPVYRHIGLYIWIPEESIPRHFTPILHTNRVDCFYPLCYPPNQARTPQRMSPEQSLELMHALLDDAIQTNIEKAMDFKPGPGAR